MATAKNKSLWARFRLHSKRKLRHRSRHYKKLIKSESFAKRYALFSLIVLFGTTLFWAILGASLQRANADQIVNSYLFNSWQALHNATLPGAHTMLLKWPLFYLIHLIGISGFTLGFFTVLTAALTVGGLTYLLHKIEPRPLAFGTICLALASVLLLVPAQPYAAGLLPVNMAMLATRNLEYLFYIASLFLIVRAPRLKSRNFIYAAALLSLLIASDKLFLTLSLGGAVIATATFLLATKKTELLNLARSWMAASVAGWAGASAIIWLVGRHVSHLVAATGSPYALAYNAHDIGLGLIYSLTGLVTNFGANPVFDTGVLRNIPGQLHARLAHIEGLSFVINFGLLVLGLWFAIRLIRWRLAVTPNSRSIAGQKDKYTQLSLLLLASSFAALGGFIVTHHAWAVDARYLGISLFALFVTLAAYLGQRKVSAQKLVLAGAVLVLAIILGTIQVMRVYDNDKAALSAINRRNNTVASILRLHKVDLLVGDYWRVLPIKLNADKSLAVMPLDSCTHPRAELSTSAWQPDLNNKKFAYLLSLDHGLTDYPTCTLDQITTAYGRPNTSSLISGTLSKPKELLLFYDGGIRKTAPVATLPESPISTVLPIALSQLPNVNCPTTTILQTVAHQDDDMLFMNPDMLHALKAGRCVRTIYLTAGDAGGNQYYWLSREQGSEAAYSKMLGFDGIWVKRIVRLGDNQYIRVDNPRGNSKVSLIFMRLPDGNVNGSGFKATNYEGLAKLQTGKIAAMHSVDKQSSYSYAQLQDALLQLMRVYGPAEIHTQATFVDKRYPDHSDHMAVSRLTRQVWQKYDPNLLIKYYIGYPIYSRPANVTGTDLQAKQDAFFAYSHFDSGVCSSAENCEKSAASYGVYLPRQYTNPE